jgi:hypothetical protein
MDNVLAELETSVQQTIEADTDFQSSLADLSDEERAQKIDERKKEELDKKLSDMKKGSEEAKKAAELAENQKIRAEKAEKKLKESKGSEEHSDENLPAKDMLALTEAKVSSLDFDEVVRIAKVLGKPITEALQDDTLKAILERRVQERASAEAANGGGGPRGKQTPAADAILAKAEKGELPESDADIAALAAARQNKRAKEASKK